MELEAEVSKKGQASTGLNQKVNHLMQMNQQLQQMNRTLTQQAQESTRAIGEWEERGKEEGGGRED
jgi:uncharacterized phage infection (PIP) family protein YhgE